MGRIPEDTIQAIRDRTDVVDLVGRYVSLKKAGRSFKGLCPFHHEKTPSFTVNPERGTFHCFGCGEGGNVFAFLMRHENLTFPEAARSLAAELGIEIPESGGEGERGVGEAVFRANAVAQALYEKALRAPEGEAARRYLVGRGIDGELAKRFGIGFAPDRWDGVASALAREGVAAEVGERAGLLKARDRGGHYDLLRGRITFPIHDVRGRVVGFGGRALSEGQEPKYLNTPESPVFRKREALYGFPAALEPIRRRDRAVVVEGYFDRIALARAGVDEAVATCGTALTEEHARNLRRRTRQVVLLFDGDEAGQRAVLRALEALLPHGLRVAAAALPGGMDPDDFLVREGPEALAALVDGAHPAFELAIARAVAEGCATPWERADAVAAVVPLLVALPDPVERGEWARRLALAAGTAASDVDAAVRRAARGAGEDDDEAPPAPLRRLEGEERHFAQALRVLVEHPALVGEVDGSELLGAAPDAGWRDLTQLVLDACPAEEPLDVSALADHLDPDARRRLSGLVAEPLGVLEQPLRARRALGDTLAWLRRRRERSEARALTARITGGSPDVSALLMEKQRQLERRRAARRSPQAAPGVGPEPLP